MHLFNFTLNKDYIIKHKDVFFEKLERVDEDLTSKGKNLKDLIGYTKTQATTAIKKGEASEVDKIATRLGVIYDINKEHFLSATKKLPEELKYYPLHEKLVFFNNYLVNQKGITLARAVSMKEKKMETILLGDRKPKKSTLKIIAEYFMMKYLDLVSYDDVPKEEELVIDEELLKVQKKDIDDRIFFFKNRHYIRKNFRVLGYGKRVKLIFSLLAVMIPLCAYTGYCTTLVTAERTTAVENYRKGSDESVIYDKYDSTQVSYYEKLQTTDKANNPDAFYVDVTVGSRLYKIAGISYSSNTYTTRMELYFKFDKLEFEQMFKHYASTVLNNLIIAEYEEENPNDKKPDDQRIADWLAAHDDYVTEWVDKHSKEYYPGETPSNVLTDKQTMFDIGNGGFVADSYGTVKELEEIEYEDENGDIRILCYQKVKFEATFEKAFDSYRYPLDSIQLKMYIQPTMDATYMRYTPDRSVNSAGESLSGFSSFFKLGNGYRLIKESKDIKNFSQKINYYQDVNNDPAVGEYDHTYKTQLEVIVRANRRGMSMFLQAFVNLFSVTIWICIAFYNQSYNGEDSIGMLGTGLFGAISSVLVGISMVSDAALFSLITMINVFTLAVIMIMTYQSIAARRAVVRQDKIQIAYNGVKLRVTFFLLIITTIIMFAGLPLISYIFTI